MTRNSWNIPDPDHLLDATRRRIKAYAAAQDLSLAAALARLLAPENTDFNLDGPKPPMERRMGSEDDTDEESGTIRGPRGRKNSGRTPKNGATINPNLGPIITKNGPTW